MSNLYLLQVSGSLDNPEWALELGLQWVEARSHAAGLVVAPPVSPSGTFADLLAWFGLPLQSLGSEKPLPAPPMPKFSIPQLPASLVEFRERGILGEMVLSYLIQLVWTPSLKPSCRPLSEIARYFRAADLHPGACRTFSWSELKDINRTRLQELTPRELVHFSRPHWGAFGGPIQSEETLEQPLLEAWALIFVDDYETIHDVARHMGKFWYRPSQAVRLELPSDWYQQAENGCLELEEEERNRLLLALTGESRGDLTMIAALLGPDRCSQRVL